MRIKCRFPSPERSRNWLSFSNHRNSARTNNVGCTRNWRRRWRQFSSRDQLLKAPPGCPLLAQSGRYAGEFRCPLLGVKRTSIERALMSAFDPKRKPTGASWPKIGGTTANVDTAPTSLAIRARPKGGAEGTAPSGLDLSGRRSSRVPAPRTELYGGACTDARRIGIVTGPALPALPRCRRAAVAAAGRRRPVHADPFPPYRGWPFRSRLRRVGSPVLLSRVAVRPFVGRALRIGTRRRHLRARGVGRQRLRAVSSQRRRDA